MLDLNMINTAARSNEAASQNPRKPVNGSEKDDSSQEFYSEYEASADREDNAEEISDSSMRTPEEKNETSSASDADVDVDPEKKLEEKALPEISETTENFPDIAAVETKKAETPRGTDSELHLMAATGRRSDAMLKSGAGDVRVVDSVAADGETKPNSATKLVTPNDTTAETIVMRKASENASLPVVAKNKSGSVTVAEASKSVSEITKRSSTSPTPAVPATIVKSNALSSAEEVRSRKEDVILTPRIDANAKQEMQASPKKMVAPAAAPIPNLISLKSTEEKMTLTPSSLSEIEAVGTVDTRHASQTAGTTMAQVLNRADTPTMIARQMAEALQKLPDRPVEISLNPRELGRVRMNIAAAEAGITVNVIAERPETLDLMRRNIDQLAREFQAMGYQDINFAFSEGEAQQSFADENSQQTETSSSRLDLISEEENTAPQQTMAASNGVDIRL